MGGALLVGMTQSLNIKGLLVGAGLALLAQVAGIALAHADCDYPAVPATEREAIQGYPDCDSGEVAAQSYREAIAGAAFCHTPTSWAEQSGPDQWVAMCGDSDGDALGTVRDMAEESCGRMVDGWAEEGIPESQLGGYDGMWEACMRLAAGGPYDTNSGAFWQVAR